VLRRPKGDSAKLLTPKFFPSANPDSSVNTPSSADEEQAYCERLLKLADTALQASQRLRKAS